MKLIMQSHRLAGIAVSLLSGFASLHVCADSDEKWVQTKTLGHNMYGTVTIMGLRPHIPTPVVISLQLRNQARLDALTSRVLAHPKARKLTSKEFMQHHAPTKAQTQEVVDYLLRNEFSDISVSKNRMLISAKGHINSLHSAFATELNFFSKNGQLVLANLTPIRVPERLSDIVLAVSGLQKITKSRPTHRQPGPKPGQNETAIHGIPPGEFSLLYRANSLAPANKTTVAVVTRGDMAQTISDLTQFTDSAGFPKPNVTVIPISSGKGSGGSGDRGYLGRETDNTIEWNLNTQLILAAAGGSVREILLYNMDRYSDTSLITAYNTIITDNRASVILLPFGICETDAFHSGYSAAANAIFQAGAAQGQTFVASVGNEGTEECNDRAKGLNYPSSSPYVMAIGGSSLTHIPDYPPGAETAWVQAAGGVSSRHQAPDWQLASGVLTEKHVHIVKNSDDSDDSDEKEEDKEKDKEEPRKKRGIPDLVFNADPQACARVRVRGKTECIGGTSLAAALFTGFWARIQSANNNKLPFPAARLYLGAADNPQWFYDILTGSNGVYRTQPGWDYVTGFGSLNVENFAEGFRDVAMPESQLLLNSNSLTGLSLPKGTSRLYRFYVPKNTTNTSTPGGDTAITDNNAELNIQLSGGKGNGDIYLHIGGVPAITNYLEKSSGPDNEETITLKQPLSGAYYLLLNAKEHMSNANIIVNYSTSGASSKVTLSKGIAITNLHFFSGSETIYAITVPEGKTNLSFQFSGGSGDGDIYAKVNDLPSINNHDARSSNFGNNETITFARPKAGIYYLMVAASKTVRRASLIANYED